MHCVAAHFKGNVVDGGGDSSISPLHSIADRCRRALPGGLGSCLLLKVVIAFIETERRSRSAMGSENGWEKRASSTARRSALSGRVT